MFILARGNGRGEAIRYHPSLDPGKPFTNVIMKTMIVMNWRTRERRCIAFVFSMPILIVLLVTVLKL